MDSSFRIFEKVLCGSETLFVSGLELRTTMVMSFGSWKKRSLFDVLRTVVDARDWDGLINADLEVLREKFVERSEVEDCQRWCAVTILGRRSRKIKD